LLGLGVLACLAIAFAGCGDDDGGGGGVTLNWYVATQPGGTIQEVAARCTEESNGRYEISVELLPTTANTQREQLVRRLAAKDSSVDLVGMDVIWTAEFANAGWVSEWPADLARQVTEGVFPSVIETASFEGRLYGAPFNTNTQLLWYRKDLVPTPPETWDEVIDEGVRLQEEGEPGKVQVQADKYEGFTVWVNALIESAGGTILSGPEEVALPQGPTEEAIGVLGKLADSAAAATDISTSNEDSARLGFEEGNSAFMVNYTFAFASATANAPDIAENMGFARYPQVTPDQPSKPPLGGFNIGVGAYSDHQEEAFEAAACVSNAESQLTATELDGLPPSNSTLYSDPVVRKAYPGFATLVRESIEDAGPRPLTPAYQDLTLAIQDALQPPDKVDPDDVGSSYDDLQSNVEDAVKREGLL
jgi:trehalose/maltose transport system substrate-binding protein